jgi:DNA-binding response OmpR family regulator
MAGERLLVVEDEDLIGDSLVRALAAQGYDAYRAATIADAQALVDERRVDLVVLDLSLPDGDGVEFCTKLQAKHPLLPVVMLTARTFEADVVVGLSAGAVDYVTKPFRLAELFARIARHLQMAQTTAALHQHVVSSEDQQRAAADGIHIDAGARRVWDNGIEVDLRPKEFDLLVRLTAEPGTVVTREQLLTDVWDENWWGSTKTLDVHINGLRRKLDPTIGVSHITTIRGVGYRWELS